MEPLADLTWRPLALDWPYVEALIGITCSLTGLIGRPYGEAFGGKALRGGFHEFHELS